MQLRLTLTACAISVAVLFIAGSFVVDRQNKTMKQLAVTSGTSIASFVATNTALHAVENSSLPESAQDWLPVQAFINSASSDPNVTDMTVIDRDGVVRAASDPLLVGTVDDDLAQLGRSSAVTQAVRTVRGADGVETFRFTQPIRYSGRNFGSVKVGMHKTGLTAAAAHMRNMLIGLAVLVVAMVGCLSYIAARTLLLPLRRLKAALRDAAAGDVDFLISHQRKDEFGELYDSFNAFALSMQSRDLSASDSAPAPTETIIMNEQDADQTSVTPAKLAVVSR